VGQFKKYYDKLNP